MFDTLIDLDTQLLLAINGAHNSFWDTFMFTFSGKLIWLPLYVSLFYVLIRNLTWKQLLFCSIGVALVILLADQICSQLIRPWVERWRPGREESPIDQFVHIVNGKRGGKYGFPSCHAANTVALMGYFFFLLRRRALTLALLAWALITCYSRAYLGVHYPGDLLVGSMIGFAAAWFVYFLLKKVAKYERPRVLIHTYVPVWTAALTTLGILIYAGIRLL